MAHFLFNRNQIYKIFSDDSFKNAFKEDLNNYTLVAVSDTDFNKVKSTKASVFLVNGAVSITDTPIYDLEGIMTEDQLKNRVNYIKSNLEKNIAESDKKNDFIAYKDFLNNLDYGNLTFDIKARSAEEYFADKGINYYNLLQVF